MVLEIQIICKYRSNNCLLINVLDGAPPCTDTDSDGVCDDDEVIGCQDSTACNYDATATDAGSCVFASDVASDGDHALVALWL